MHPAEHQDDHGLHNHIWNSAVESPCSSTSVNSPQLLRSELAVGAKSIVGGRPTMEDAFAVLPDGIRTRPSSVSSCSGAVGSVSMTAGNECARQSPGAVPEDVFSYFAVFDGHGGNEAAQHCATRLHLNLQESLLEGSKEPSIAQSSRKSLCVDDKPVTAISSHCICRETPDFSCRACLNTQHICAALKHAFKKTDGELSGTEIGEVVGSTAVVALVGSSHIFVAHCGDSRAVISRGGTARALTADHKPNRQDECARVEAAGGKVLHKGGSHRVMGLLAMSRAIGDHFLRPFIVADPEVSCHLRQLDDEVLLIATDGLWDVFTNDDAMALAIRCIDRARLRGASMRAACRIAASVLTKAALERGSRDNITVILVDLRSGACQRRTSVSGEGLAERAGTPASAAGTPPPVPPLALRRSRSQDCTKQLLQEVSGEMPIRRASSHNSVATKSLAGSISHSSAFEVAQRRCQQQMTIVEQPPAAPPAEEAEDAQVPAFNPAISLPPLMAPVTPLEVRLGKLRTTTDGPAERPLLAPVNAPQPQLPTHLALPAAALQQAPVPVAPALGLKLPPKAVPASNGSSSSSNASTTSAVSPQDSLPYMPSDDPFSSWSSPVLFTQATAPVPSLQKPGSGSYAPDGFGHAGLMATPSAPALCEQVSS